MMSGDGSGPSETGSENSQAVGWAWSTTATLYRTAPALSIDLPRLSEVA
jgi:hypothetical protein